MLNQIGFFYLSLFVYTLGNTWDCPCIVRVSWWGQELSYGFVRIAYSHISAYLGTYSDSFNYLCTCYLP